MSNLNYHPAPGLGDLLAGAYVVPQNPIQMAREGISVVPALGDFVAASFVVPQNPLRDQVLGITAPIGQGISGRRIIPKLSGMGLDTHAYGDEQNLRMRGVGGCGGSCGCGGGCSHGMGDISADFTKFTTDLSAGNYSAALTTDTIMGIPVIGILAGIGILIMMNKGRR
jgi:hypothetical protein